MDVEEPRMLAENAVPLAILSKWRHLLSHLRRRRCRHTYLIPLFIPPPFIPPPPLIPIPSLLRLLVHRIARPFCADDRKLWLGARHRQCCLPQCFRALASNKWHLRSGLGQLRRWLLYSKLTIETQILGGAIRHEKLAWAALGVHFERSQRFEMVGGTSRDPLPHPPKFTVNDLP
eukprot:366259-Chlamydomonas_euryale.AAC.7